ncbi:MAG: efflux RND transporter periplasmic adaptor subunit [Leptolyngbyaceae bacterium]|nr:efflux RND transporter periplasmic adaptor subunit [Leptolyngbyaceae bacterium]
MTTTPTETHQSAVSASRFQKSRPWLWWLIALLALGTGGYFLWRSLAAGQPPQGGFQSGPVPVTLDTLEQETVTISSGFVGTLDAQRGVVLKPEVDGQITRIYVSPGQSVSAGELIVELSPDRSQAELGAARASVGAAQALLANSQAQLRAAESNLVSAQSEVRLQEDELERFQFLVNEGAQSQQELDVVQRDYEAAIADRDAAEDQVEAAVAAEAQAEASLSQARSEAAAVQSDFEDTQIAAPIDGIVGDFPIKLGDFVEVGDELTTITQNETLELELSVPIERQDELRVGLPVQLRRFSGDDLQIDGRLSFVSPLVDAATQSVLVKAIFQNASGRLQDDQRVEAFIIWEEVPGVMVPASAVSRLGGQTFIFVAEPQPDAAEGEPQWVARQRLVTLGQIQDNSYHVLEGLEPGDQIVTTGILNLSDGAPIQPQEESQESAEVSP